MFGCKKLMTALVENVKLIAKEQVNRTDLEIQKNALLVKQNEHLRTVALYTRRIDEFNRMAYQAGSGYQMPESPDDEKSLNEFQETQVKERDAVNDMYYSDISLGGTEEE